MKNSITLYSECIYDVDNRYADLEISPLWHGQGFVLSMRDSSIDEDTNLEIKMFLTKDTLKIIIDRLTKVLEDSKKV